MPKLKLPLKTLSDVLGLSDTEFSVTGARMLNEGFIEFEVNDDSNTLKNPDAVVQVNFSQCAVIRTLTAAPPVVETPVVKPIMLWYRMNDKQQWEYNHYSDGHVTDAKGPQPAHPEHVKMWKKGKWAYAFAEMQMNHIAKVINVGNMVTCQ